MSELHADDPRTWKNCIWAALHAHHEENPTHFEENPDEWGDICTAMAYIQEEIGCPELIVGDNL